MSQKEIKQNKSMTLLQPIKNESRFASTNKRLSQGDMDLRQTQVGKLKYSRLKSTHTEFGSQKQLTDGGILSDYNNIEQISSNHMRLSKLNFDIKSQFIQNSFNDSYNITRERSGMTNGTTSQRISSNNSTQVKFHKIDATSTSILNSLQSSPALNIQQLDSTRLKKTSAFYQNQNLDKEDTIIEDNTKRKNSQVSMSILKEIQQPRNGNKDESIFIGVNESTRSFSQGNQGSNQGNILQFAVGNNILHKASQPSSQLINSRDLEKMNILRKEGVKMKPNENFYMQLISNDQIILPRFEKNYLALKRERYLENNKQIEQKNKQNTSQNTIKTLPNILLDDGSILDIERFKSLTNNSLKANKFSHHNSQNSGFRKPDERKDAKMLSDWLDEMINKVYTEQITSYYDFYEKFELIFDGVISEICRQLQTECSERSQLLRKVWSEFFLKTQKTNIKIETENFRLVNNVHKMYLTDIANQNECIQDLQEKLEIKENYMNKLRSENRYLRKKWKKLEQGNEILKSDLEQQLQNYEESVKENQILKMRIESLLTTQQNEFFDQFNRNEYKERFNDEIEKIRNQLLTHFTQLYDEQRSKLEAAYNIRQNLKEKEQLLAQKIEAEDAEYEKSRLNVPRVDQDAFDEMILDNKCVDTSDLYKVESKAVDTENLITYQTIETQATPAPIKQVSRPVQATVKMDTMEVQVDMRQLQQNNQSLSYQRQRDLDLLNENFNEYINTKYQLKRNRLERVKNIDQFSVDFKLFKQSFGEILYDIPMKEEFSYNDTTTIVRYLDSNIQQVVEYIAKLFSENKNQKNKITSSVVSIVENRVDIIVNSNRVVLYHLYIKLLAKGQIDFFIKDDLVTQQSQTRIKSDVSLKIDSASSLDKSLVQQKEQLNRSDNRKSSFFQDKLISATKKVFNGVGFYKAASQKKITSEEKIKNYEKFQEISQNYENKKNQKEQNKIKIQTDIENKFKFESEDFDTLNEDQQTEEKLPQLTIGRGSSKRQSSIRKITNSSISENSSEESKSESNSSQSSESNSNDNEDNEGNQDIENKRNSTKRKSSSKQRSQRQQNQEIKLFNKSEEKNDQQFFNLIHDSEDTSKIDNDLTNNLSLANKNSLSPLNVNKRDQLKLNLSPFKNQQNRKSSSIYDFQEQLTPRSPAKIIEEEKNLQLRRRSSVMNQMAENARVSFILDFKQNEQTVLTQQNSNSQQGSPRNSSMSSFYNQNVSQYDVSAKQKISTAQLLRELKIINPVENIFNRLRVSRNSNKVTREATQIIEQVLNKVNKNKSFKTETIEYKLPNLLKLLGNIMTDLLKFVKKNNSINYPHFHSFTFENFINNFGYSQSTEKKFSNMVKSCFYYKSQHTKINMYYKLLVGEIDYIDYKFMIEVTQKLDEGNQQPAGAATTNNEKQLIGWSKVYEFFMQYFGQVIPVKSYQEYERQLQQMKIKQQQSNKIMINVDEAIEFMMNIYQQEIKSSFCMNYSDLFSIVDIYDCNFLSLDQFYILYYSIEPQDSHLNKNQLTQIFMQEYDLQLSAYDSTLLQGVFDDSFALFNSFTNAQVQEYGIQRDIIYGLSIYRFCQICIDYEFLSLTKQSKFLGPGIEIQASQLNLEFDEQMNLIKKRLAYSGKYKVQYHLQIKALKNYLSKEKESNDKVDTYFKDKKFENSKQAIITYKVLENVSKQHYLTHVIEQDLLVQPLLQLQEVFTNVSSKFKNKKTKNQQ